MKLIPLLLLTAGILSACNSSSDLDQAMTDAAESDAGEAATESSSSGLSEQELNISAVNASPRELDWEELIPEGFRLEALMDEAGIQFDEELDDNDPRAQVLMDQIQNALNKAPSVADLDGQLVRIPGFVVPLEWAEDGKHLTEFLLVPYYGACIHVPPPPANQTVHVALNEPDKEERRAFDTVWVEGIIRAERTDMALATSGYRVDALKVETYSDEVSPQ